MSKKFKQLGYRSQLIILRQLASKAVKLYPIKVKKLEFIHHGENCTYKVTAREGVFLLRLHRQDYHNKNAINEELEWLRDLSTFSDLTVQKPLYSLTGEYLVNVSDSKNVLSRNCSLLEFHPGKFKYYKLSEKNFFYLGELLGYLHETSKNRKVKYRKYWNLEGMLGDRSKFCAVNDMKKVFPRFFGEVSAYRKYLYKNIKKFEQKNLDTLGLIHSDLHFKNLIWQRDKLIPIDFDDSGIGYYMYDIAVSFDSAINFFEKKGKLKTNKYIEAFFDGYSLHRIIRSIDIEMISYFLEVRMLVMITWLFERRDHPKLYNYFKMNMNYFSRHIKSVLINGPQSIKKIAILN